MSQLPHEAQSSREALQKSARFERLESRIVMSGHGLTNFAMLDIQDAAMEHVQTASVTLNQVHQQTGVNHIHQNYGFEGQGQTVVVIDSGIAWDHYALGGGFGEGHRVVGGWDFANNDADPFDGGSAGFHGTHVAGIIGSSDANNLGVSSAVDLVALRVFNDQGSGSFEHVRQALAWVNANINEFENPITTVNLSLGTSWNSDQIPNWANLESEFAALKAKGVFISVAAGNSFQTYQTTGVSYPAASSHVVPVASHGNSGQISSFSQRNERVLVAPGESIRSTVPGHLLGDSVSSKFLAASGTSMAAPYVAGVSVLMREAMEFMGYSDVDQDVIYQRLRQTADQVYDSVTGRSYHHINLRAAMESVVLDLHGDTAQTASDIGTLQGGEQLAGTIGTFSDVDAVRFTAGRSGTMTLSLQQTHQLDLQVQLEGHVFQRTGDTVTFEVQAGQEYTLLLSTTNGIGHYTLDAAIQAQSVQATDWGTVFAKEVNLQNTGTQWYQVTAGRQGILAFQMDAQNAGQATINVYNSQQQWMGSATTEGDVVKYQTQVQAGEVLLFSVTGDVQGEVTLQNLIGINNGVLTINGNNQSNQIEIQDGAQVQVSIDGVTYSVERSDLVRINVYAHGGQNDVNLVQNYVGNQTAHIHQGRFFVFGSDYTIWGHQLRNIQFQGHADDTVRLYDTAGDDVLIARAGHTEISGANYHNQVFGVGRVVGVASQGNDSATLVGTSGNDMVYSNPVYTTLTSSQHWTLARGFDSIHAEGNGGVDLVAAFGSDQDEHLTVQEGYSEFRNQDWSRSFSEFRQQQFFAVGGTANTAQLSSGSNQVSFDAYWNRAYFSAGQQSTFLSGFQQVNAVGNATSRAILFDSSGNDAFEAEGGWGRMTGNGYSNQAVGFGLTIARFTAGADLSSLFNVGPSVNLTQMSGRLTAQYSGFEVRTVGFPSYQFSANLFGQSMVPTGVLTAATPLGSSVLGSSVHATLLGGVDVGVVSWQANVWASRETASGSLGIDAVAVGSVTQSDRAASARADELRESRAQEMAWSSAVQAVFDDLGQDQVAVVAIRPSWGRVTTGGNDAGQNTDWNVFGGDPGVEADSVDRWFETRGL